MSDIRYLSKEFLVEFIELYRQHLSWKIKSKEYTNKNLQNEAYDALVNLCKTIDLNPNRDLVSKKISQLEGLSGKK
jgi:hypothetical protein